MSVSSTISCCIVTAFPWAPALKWAPGLKWVQGQKRTLWSWVLNKMSLKWAPRHTNYEIKEWWGAHSGKQYISFIKLDSKTTPLPITNSIIYVYVQCFETASDVFRVIIWEYVSLYQIKVNGHLDVYRDLWVPTAVNDKWSVEYG